LDVAAFEDSDFGFDLDEPGDAEDDESLDEPEDDDSPSFVEVFFESPFFGASPAAPPVPLP
jgi:hypothetical protein